MCPHCHAKMSKVIYAGLPGRFCEHCTMFMGIASWAARIHFNGVMMIYQGSYLRALWCWLMCSPV